MPSQRQGESSHSAPPGE